MSNKTWLASGITVAFVLALMAGLAAAAPQAAPLGSAFTYQGRLLRDESPYDGTCNLRFGLRTALTGAPISAPRP
jgi:hypothetical protein